MPKRYSNGNGNNNKTNQSRTNSGGNTESRNNNNNNNKVSHGGGGGGGGFVGLEKKRKRTTTNEFAAGLSLDPLLVPRLKAYKNANGANLRDIDGVLEHLLESFREYKRKPKGVFRKTVERACAFVQNEEKRQRGGGAGGDNANINSDDDDDDDDDDDYPEENDDSEDDDSEDSEEWSEEGEEKDRGHDMDVMNRALQSTYATASRGSGGGEFQNNNKSSVSGIQKGSVPSAFASVDEVKAAAMRALEKGEINPFGGKKGSDIDNDDDEANEEPERTLAEKAQISGHERAVHAVMKANQRNNKNNKNSNVGRTEVKDRQLHITTNSGGSKKGDKKRSKRKRRREAEEDQAIADLKKRMKADTNYDFHGGGDRENNAENLFSQATKPRKVSLSDLGGVEDALSAIDELILRPLKHPELYDWLGVPPPRGVLLHGPPGCGKTTVAHAVANAAIENNTNSVTFFCIAATEIVSGVSGDSEKHIRQLFRAAKAAAPSIIFIDEIDAICPKRESAQREMERRIVAQFLASIDDLNVDDEDEENEDEDEEGNKNIDDVIDRASGKIDEEMEDASKSREENKDNDRNNKMKEEKGKQLRRKRHVVVIGATNRADSLDAALRRSGRFDREIALGVPDEQARVKILKCHLKNLRLSGDVDEIEIAKKTPGYVGADLAALVNEAATLAVSRVFENAKKNVDEILTECRLKDSAPLSTNELISVAVTNFDFMNALLVIQPSAKREGFTTTPSVTWSDVGALEDIREELKFSIVEPINRPHVFQYLGQKISTGCLLYGPPGCGKTLVAQAVANEANANFISIKGPELLNKYVGESERAVRSLFARARAAAPCVLFFDELDSLAPRRSGGGEGGGDAAVRVVNQLLTEMDGMESRKATFVIAATNRPDMIDPAMLRPGRLDKLLYIPLPDKSAREDILKALIRKIPIFSSVAGESVSETMTNLIRDVSDFKQLEGFSGADLASLVREACVCAIRENLKLSTGEDSMPSLRLEHFRDARTKVFPSVNARDREGYLKLRDSLRGVTGALKKEIEEDD